MDCRLLPCYPVSEVMEKMRTVADAVEGKYGVQVSLDIVQSDESPATPDSAPVVRLLTTALKKVHGIEARLIGIGGGTVAAPLRSAGYAAVVWSTLDDMAHQPNEYCLIKNIVSDAQVMAALMYGADAI